MNVIAAGIFAIIAQTSEVPEIPTLNEDDAAQIEFILKFEELLKELESDINASLPGCPDMGRVYNMECA